MINLLILSILELNGEGGILKVWFIYLNDENPITHFKVSNNTYYLIDVLL